MIPNVLIVGADKGGVGKTMISRALMDYYAVGTGADISYRAFDTEAPHGVLKRFQSDKTEVVDLTKSDGQMRVFDTLKSAQVTIIDVRAGLLSPTLNTLAEIGFLDAVKTGTLRISLLHVLGGTHASIDEIKATSAAMAGARHFLVTNHANDTTFLGLSDALKSAGAGVIDIEKLNELAADHVDADGLPFEKFMTDETKSLVLRGYVRAWLGRVFKQFEAAGLNKLG